MEITPIIVHDQPTIEYKYIKTITELLTQRPSSDSSLYVDYLKRFEDLVMCKFWRATYENRDIYLVAFFDNFGKYTEEEQEIITNAYWIAFKKMVQNGRESYIDIVLNHRPDIYTDDEYDFATDAYENKPLDKYIEAGIDPNIINGFPLVFCCVNKNYDSAKKLLDYKANVHINLIRENKRQDMEYPLMMCIKKGNLDMTKLMVNYGANIHADFDEALYSSLLYQHHDITHYLLEQRADPNARNGELPGFDKWTNGNVILSAMLGHKDWKKDLGMLQYLIKIKADVTAKNDQLLPLFLKECHIELVRILLMHNADITVCEPLILKHYADETWHDRIDLLTKYGANHPVKNKSGAIRRFKSSSAKIKPRLRISSQYTPPNNTREKSRSKSDTKSKLKSSSKKKSTQQLLEETPTWRNKRSSMMTEGPTTIGKHRKSKSSSNYHSTISKNTDDESNDQPLCITRIQLEAEAYAKNNAEKFTRPIIRTDLLGGIRNSTNGEKRTDIISKPKRRSNIINSNNKSKSLI